MQSGLHIAVNRIVRTIERQSTECRTEAKIILARALQVREGQVEGYVKTLTEK